MADVSPHALIQSFIAGLGDFLATLVAPPGKPTRLVQIWINDTNQNSWVCDRDCNFRGVIGNHATFVLTLYPVLTGSLLAGNTKVNPDGVLWAISTVTAMDQNAPPVRIRISAGQKLYFNSGATGISVMLVLEDV